MYEDLEVSDNEEDDAVDAAGYTGNFRRNEKDLVPISESQFMEIIRNNNKMVQIMSMIYEIDKDANGYVTSTEIDDILKILYPNEFGNKKLKNILKPFCSSANKVLLDYKAFRKFMNENLEDPDVKSKFNEIGKKMVKPNLENLKNPNVKNESLKRLEVV